MPSAAQGLVAKYSEKLPSYKRFEEKLRELVRGILPQTIKIHAITSRCKKPDALEKKIQKKEGKYSELPQVTDLVGVRIITNFAEDVDLIAQVIEREFTIDKPNSIDKRAVLEPDRFGYLSLHYVVELSNTRSALPEYSEFSQLKAEIQIRSILQHAWAEIEHGLGYKAGEGVPRTVRRRFARIAGLLEVADCEFDAIRSELSAYAKQVREAIPIEPEGVELDAVSLYEFIIENPTVKRYDQLIADQLGQVVGNEKMSLHGRTRWFEEAGINTIAKLEDYLRQYGFLCVAIHKRLEENTKKEFPHIDRSKNPAIQGACLFYLAYVALLKSKGKSELVSLFEQGYAPREMANKVTNLIVEAIQGAESDAAQMKQ